MQERRLRGFLAFLVILSAVLAGSATKPAANPGSASSEHQRIVDFWTTERVAQAIPRDFVKTGPNQYQLATRPTKGGPGGGGRPTSTTTSSTTSSTSSTTTTTISTGGGGTTGASWNGDADIANSTGKVLFAMGSSYYVCSASVVNDPSNNDRSIVLTAGHCVYDQATHQFATNWMYIPNYDAAPARLTTSGSFCGSTEHGCWTATSLVAHNGFTTQNQFNDTAVVYDFGFAVLLEGGKSGGLVESLGSHAIAYNDNGAGVVADAFGYPAAQKYKGNDLVYCEGPIGFDAQMGGATYRIACDMTGGSSGGPWLRDFTGSSTGTLTSLNSYGYSGDRSMYGPKFNNNTAAVYNAALSVGSNTVVGP